MSASGKVNGGDQERGRQVLSIEQLLIWAYAYQMVHRATRTPLIVKSKGPLAAYSSLWSEGATPIDSSSSQGFSASDDAWAVHDQVMKLGKINMDCGQDLAAARYHALGQYRGAEPPLGHYGTVDKTTRAWPTDGLLELDQRSLVMVHASRSTRPEVPGEPDFRFAPAEMVWNPKRRSGPYQKGWFQHVSVKGTLPGDVAEIRQIYRTWRNGLDLVRRGLKPIRLLMFKLSDVMPPPF